MNQNENKTPIIPADFGPIYKFCAILFAIATVLAVFTYKKVEEPLIQIALFTLSGMLLSFSVYLLRTVIKAKKFTDRRVNYFLYDKKHGGDRHIDSLTFTEIREKIQRYMSLFRRGKNLYLGDLFDENLKIPQVFRPLFCFEILYAMSEDTNQNSRAKLFLSFGVDCAGAFYAHLSKAGATELADDIKKFFSDFAAGANNEGEFLEYLRSKKKTIEEWVFKYLREHINEF